MSTRTTALLVLTPGGMRLFTLVTIFGAAAAMALGAAAEGCAGSTNTGLPDASMPGSTGTGSGTGVGTGGPEGGIPLGTDSGSTGTGTGIGSTGTGSGTSGTTDAGTDATPEASTSPEAGSGSGSDSGGNDAGDTGTGSDAGSGSGTGDAGTCFKPPSKLFAETTAGVYCPFSGVDGGANVTCTATQHCCEPPTGTSTCIADTAACATNNTDWRCEGAPDCPGAVCCGTGNIEMQAACGAYPAFPYISGFTGSKCLAACNTATNSYQVCSKSSECPTTGGATGTCVPIEPKGNPIGYCN